MARFGSTTTGLGRSAKTTQRGSAAAGDAGFNEVRSFGFNPGALRMLTHVPRDLPQRAPLVVVLHGCTQRAGAHAHAAGWVTLADRLGFAVLAPEQDRANNPNRCFNWFQPGDITRGSGEAASIHSMIEHMMRDHGLDARRVFVTGLSAGGAMAAVLLATYPETFAAGSVIAGLPFGVACSVQEALAAMSGGSRLTSDELAALVARAAPAPGRRPRLSIWHGQADGTVAIGNAKALARQWARLHGLGERADETAAHGGWTRSVWRDRDGAAVVELNLLAGLGHGTPLAAGGEDPIGEASAFMLEAGVSSSLETARFWGLAPEAAPANAPHPNLRPMVPEGPTIVAPASHGQDASGRPEPAAEPEAAPAEPGGRSRKLGEGVLAAVASHVPEDVKAVIAKALASAGLLR